MSNIKKYMPFILLVVYLASVYYLVSNKTTRRDEYSNYVEQAREYATHGIIADSMKCYENALRINPTVDLSIEAGRVYLDNENFQLAEKWYKSKLLGQFPKEVKTYLFGIEVYKAQDKLAKAFECYEAFTERKLKSDEIEIAMDEIRYVFNLIGNFEEVSVFSNINNLAAVKESDQLWGYIDSSGQYKTKRIYSKVDTFADFAAVVDNDEVPFYIDASGNKKISASQIEEKDVAIGKITEFRSVASDLILATNGEIWNYYKIDSFEKAFGPFSGATLITNGVGAVCDADGKWALISDKGNLITEYLYDEIVADAKGIVCRGDAIIVKENRKYFLVDKNGKKITDAQYDSAKPFYENNYTAVKKGTKWIFVDLSGNEMDLGEFQDAYGFSNGLAGVKQHGKWGYINLEGKLVIDCQFMDVGPLSSKGVAFVQANSDSWSLMRLLKNNY